MKKNVNIDDEEFSLTDKALKKTVFIKNINLTTSEEELKTFLDSCIKGSYNKSYMMEIRLAIDEKGFSKGFAYIDFPNIETANRCLECCNNKRLDDNELICAISKPPSSG